VSRSQPPLQLNCAADVYFGFSFLLVLMFGIYDGMPTMTTLMHENDNMNIGNTFGQIAEKHYSF